MYRKYKGNPHLRKSGAESITTRFLFASVFLLCMVPPPKGVATGQSFLTDKFQRRRRSFYLCVSLRRRRRLVATSPTQPWF